MTWNGMCPECKGKTFACTVNSTADVHVNCANPGCSTYIGKMPATEILHPLSLEPPGCSGAAAGGSWSAPPPQMDDTGARAGG